ncbi:hypothetical protein C8J56DRAFT_802349, partial [Mycena floridula]
DGIPQVLPGDYSATVQMVVQDSDQYRYPNPGVKDEWYDGLPYGAGVVQTSGPTLFISMVHQYHCIETFGQKMTRIDKAKDWSHMQHCLNYIREMALCNPDLTLEPGDFAGRNFSAERVSAVHVCRDLGPVYEKLERNWLEWVDFRDSQNIEMDI